MANFHGPNRTWNVPHDTSSTQTPYTEGCGGGARFINVTSGAAVQPELNQTIYAASKAATCTMSKCWANELPPKYGCTVNSVSPGAILTKGPKVTMQGMEDILLPIFDARTPMPGAYGQPEDVAWAVAFLAEARSNWINGAVLNVSGGMIRM
jgi:NAD(P)-dependent dehydrogenase (short-subunit alcohol dehydrogenase family)